MWKSKGIIAVILMIVLATAVFPDVIRFKYQKGIKYKILTTAETDVFFDGMLDNSMETLYKIAVEILDVKEDSGQISGIFQTSERASGSNGLFKLTDEEYHVVYWRDARGKYSSPAQQLLPQIRHVPLFPATELAAGDSWEAAGEEVFDLSDYGINEPVYVPLNVNYIYIKNETIAEVECAVFRIYYTFVLNLGKRSVAEFFPLKITGHSNQHYFFDIQNGRPFFYEDTYDTLYIFNTGEIYELKGKSRGEVIEGANLDKDQMVKELEEAIEKEGIEDTTVTKEADGVKITLEDINFLPESDLLLPNEQEKLNKIAEFLKKYPDKDLLIGGHTALAGTEEGRQQLSENRARAVGEFLLSLGVRRENQLVYKGFGARIPLADNATEAGKKRNRRVEIKILDN